MSGSFNLKDIFKKVFTNIDPEARLPIGPNNSVIVGNAVGPRKEWTDVYGFSEARVGIYGEGPIAGLFEGEVYVNGKFESGDTTVQGNLTVNGNLSVNGHSINALVQQIAELSQKVEDLSNRTLTLETSGVTRNGMPVHAPASRPTISTATVNITTVGGEFKVTGQGFRRLGPIVFGIYNMTKQTDVAVIGQVVDPTISTSTIITQGDGSIDVSAQISCSVGDVLRFSATDGRDDPNDITGTLWSTPLTATVSGSV